MSSVTKVSGHLAGKTKMLVYFNYTLKPGNVAVLSEAVVCITTMENSRSSIDCMLPCPR